jgi:hypothetical protein
MWQTGDLEPPIAPVESHDWAFRLSSLSVLRSETYYSHTEYRYYLHPWYPSQGISYHCSIRQLVPYNVNMAHTSLSRTSLYLILL